jgi:hypothetical protein
MRLLCALLVAAVILGAGALPAYGELQNVEVGGEVRIRYNHIINNYPSPGPFALRWPSLPLLDWLSARPSATWSATSARAGRPPRFAATASASSVGTLGR